MTPPDLFHLALPDDWEAAVSQGEYRTSTRGRTLDDVGFVHCARSEQVTGVADRFYADVDLLLVLRLDPSAIPSEIRDEPAVEGGTERFPHVYGPIPVTAVTVVSPWFRAASEGWSAPPL